MTPTLLRVRRHPVFLTRKFPPSVGGMETLASGVWRSMGTARPDSVLIAHSGTNKALIWWVPLAIARLLAVLVRRRAEVVLTGDALMYALAAPLLRLFRIRHATMIMGLDVTYENAVYRAIVHPALRRAEQVISISEATAERARQFGVPADRITVLRLGVKAPPTSTGENLIARTKLHDMVGLPETELLLLTLGRLVPRKGAAWFVEFVLPRLPGNAHYVLAGDGSEAKRIAEVARSAGVRDRVHLLGRVDDDQREIVMRGADIFIQPNVAVPGDMEGFGLVTIEAAMRHTLVVAADLEGIKDAVVDGETGLLLPSGGAEHWVARLTTLLADPAALTVSGTKFGIRVDELYGETQMGRALTKSLGLTPS
ncbi:MAG: Phosphatidylinositol alpha,6-mannosyltransferase [Frankiales bacterium]|nr:Phosphatidylinositol alpha,6-mannosyltransferase [Frankiales bacterium]